MWVHTDHTRPTGPVTGKNKLMVFFITLLGLNLTTIEIMPFKKCVFTASSSSSSAGSSFELVYVSSKYFYIFHFYILDLLLSLWQFVICIFATLIRSNQIIFCITRDFFALNSQKSADST